MKPFSFCLRRLLPAAGLLLTVSCGGNADAEFFNGEIRFFNDRDVAAQHLESHSVDLDDAPMGIVAAYDSLILCWTPQQPDFFYNIYHADTGGKLGSFVRKGRGPREAVSLNCAYQLVRRGDDLTTWLYAVNEERLFQWNISRSLRERTTVYDTIMPCKIGRIGSFYQLARDTLLVSRSSSDNLGEASVPYYEKRTLSASEPVCEYRPYRVAVESSSAFYTWDAVKPDGSRVVQAMRFLPQINVLDLRTGNLFGSRLKGAPGFSLMQDVERLTETVYYTGVCADDRYIYAVFREGDDSTEFGRLHDHIIHIFDWEGRLCARIETDRPYERCWLDPVRNRLYAMDMATNEIHYLELSQLDLP